MKKIGTIYDFGNFKKSLKEVMQKPSRNKNNPIAEVVRCEIINNKVALTYTDTFRLTHKEFENSVNFNKDMLIYLSFPLIRQLMDVKKFEKVQVFETENGNLFFKSSIASMFGNFGENIVKINDINYPDYNSVLRSGAGRIT